LDLQGENKEALRDASSGNIDADEEEGGMMIPNLDDRSFKRSLIL
jgi:hypothetical protein